VDEEFVRVSVEPPDTKPDLHKLGKVIPQFALEDGRDIMTVISDLEACVFQILAYSKDAFMEEHRIVPIDSPDP
jgi:hypothetical protein